MNVKKKIYKWDNKVILITEDEEINFILLYEILSKTKAKVIRAKNGIEAVEICRTNNKVNLVLMDIQMPGISGNEAARQIKQFRKELPIIAQTANVDTGEYRKTFQSGVDDFVSKPIRFKELLFKIDKYLERY